MERPLCVSRNTRELMVKFSRDQPREILVLNSSGTFLCSVGTENEPKFEVKPCVFKVVVRVDLSTNDVEYILTVKRVNTHELEHRATFTHLEFAVRAVGNFCPQVLNRLNT